MKQSLSHLKIDLVVPKFVSPQGRNDITLKLPKDIV